MSGSVFFFLHLIGFGLITPVIVGGWVLEFRFRSEPDLRQRLYLLRLIRTLGLLSPGAALLLLVTGIGNIDNTYGGTMTAWYSHGPLVAKIILFAVLLVNGTVFGPVLSRRRSRLLRSLADGSGPAEAEDVILRLNNQLMWFYVVQSILLLAILFLSAYGSSKHPGSL